MRMAGGWVVYILRCDDGSLYTGMTNDLLRRLRAHQEGRGARYTRGRGPFERLYVEPCPDRSAAARREAEIKRMSRHEKLNLAGASSHDERSLACGSDAPPPSDGD